MKWKISLLLVLCVGLSKFCLAQKQTVPKKKEICLPEKNKKSEIEKMENSQKNVLGTALKLASIDPITGYFRTGYCSTDQNDRGVHVVAAVVTDAFLQYSKAQGNDLISAYPASGFPGLKAGNVWCLCALRWREALAAGVAPPVILEATNIKALDYVSLEELKKHSIK
jgi:uncharacterized protein (DUF2237 family)